MSAEILRKAAALMRERAEGARSYYAAHHPKAGQEAPWFGEADLYDFDPGDGPHIIAMSPAVALAVADWLATEAAHYARYYPNGHRDGELDTASRQALTVARAYLGEQP